MNANTEPADDDLPGQPRVLLVDDDEVNLLLTSIALRERGFEITEATGGEQAIRAARELAARRRRAGRIDAGT